MKSNAMILFILLFSTIALGSEVDLKTFNEKMNKNIDSVLADNPEVYETKSSGRSPASVKPKVDPTSKQLDEFEEQAAGQKSW